MGSKYYVKVWGKHFGEGHYSLLTIPAGQKLIPALWVLVKTHLSKKWSMVQFEAR